MLISNYPLMLTKLFQTIEKITPVKWRWIFNHEGFRRYFANTGWMFLGQAFGLLMSFLVGAWVIRYLGPERYGIFSYALAFAGLFSFLASLGVDNILQRELVNTPEKRDQLMGTALVMKLVGGGIAFIVTVGTIFLIDSSNLVRFLVLIQALALIIQAFGVISLFFQAQVQAKKNIQSQIMAGLISSALKVILILNGLGVIWLMLIYVLDSVWISLFLFRAYQRSGLKVRAWRFKLPLAKQIFRSSWLLALTNASMLVYMKIDQVMIGQIIDKQAVGLYASTVRVFELTYVAPAIIAGSLFPAILNARKTDLQSYHNRLRSMGKLLAIISILIALATTLLAKYIIIILFGADYSAAIITLQIGAWSIVGMALTYLVNQYLIAEDKIKFYFIITLIGAIVNIGLNYYLIPHYGINGAAIATIIAYLVVPGVGMTYFNLNRKKHEKQ